MRKLILFAALLMAGLEAPLVGRADDDTEVREAVNKMLDVGWKPSIAANTQIDRIYESLNSSSDWRVHYGYALAKMRQWRYAEAVVAAQRVGDVPDAQVPARQMIAWLLTVQKKYPAALVELERLSAALPDGDGLTDEQKERRAEIIHFIGRLYGYLSGPAVNALTDFERESRRRRIAKSFSDEERDTFDAEAKRVTEQFATRIDEKERLVETSRREAEAARRKRLDELAELQKRLADELDKIAADRSAAEDEFDETVRRLQEADDPLRDRFAALDNEAAAVRRQLARVNIDILRIEEQLSFEDDPSVRAVLLQDLSRLSVIASSSGQELSRLESAAESIHAERLDIAGQQRQAEGRFQSEVRSSEKRRGNLEKQSQRADAEQKRMLKELPRTTPQARALDRQAKAFSTYLSFPLDDEKLRLLKSFGP